MNEYCPECKSPLLPPGNRCKCGWRSKIEMKVQGSPVLSDLLGELAGLIVSVSADARHPKMPHGPMDAAKWWLTILEREHRSDIPRKVPNMVKAGTHWEWPYRVEACHTLKIFIDSERRLQDFVLAAREDGIFWRGDDLEFFGKVVDETLKMREKGVERYRKDSIRKMERQISRMAL